MAYSSQSARLVRKVGQTYSHSQHTQERSTVFFFCYFLPPKPVSLGDNVSSMQRVGVAIGRLSTYLDTHPPLSLPPLSQFGSSSSHLNQHLHCTMWVITGAHNAFPLWAFPASNVPSAYMTGLLLSCQDVCNTPWLLLSDGISKQCTHWKKERGWRELVASQIKPTKKKKQLWNSC